MENWAFQPEVLEGYARHYETGEVGVIGVSYETNSASSATAIARTQAWTFFELLPRCPDLVIGGINHGDNSAVNVHYSGTMGVVIEGCLKGVPAIGYSLCDHDADADFNPMLPYVRKIAEEVLVHGLPKGTCLNVNVPKTSELKGVRICRQTDASWGNEWCKGQHPKGGEYFWLTGKFTNNEPEAEETDRWALEHDYVAITPIQIDMTAYALIDTLKTWNLNL